MHVKTNSSPLLHLIQSGPIREKYTFSLKSTLAIAVALLLQLLCVIRI